MKLVIGVLSAWLLSVATLVQAGTPVAFEVDSKQSPVTFLAIGKPGFLRIKGEGALVSGSAEMTDLGLRGTFKVALADFRTGIDLRDQHMKEKYLEVAKYPEAVLVLDPMKVGLTGKEASEFTGQFSLKGKSKSIKGTASLTTEGDKVEGEAKFSISLAEFDVGIPSHLGVKVAEDVEITVKIVGIKKAANAH